MPAIHSPAMMTREPPAARLRSGRLLAALVVAIVTVAAITQQFVPHSHIQLTTQFAEVPLRDPRFIRVLLALGSILAQLIVLTLASRALERRKFGVWSASLTSLLAGVVVSAGFNLVQTWLLGTFDGLWVRVLKGVIGGFEVYGLWMLAFRYPEIVYASRLHILEAERARQAAELLQLREHLQPHFLRNTLNAIAALIDEEPSEARDLLAAVADLLTDSIEDCAPQRSLGDEVAWLRRYAEILEARYRGSLQFAWDEAPMTSATMVPRLLLQPLVENAVHHGALARRTDGCVTVRTRARLGGGVIVEVEDNGPGIPAGGASAVGLGLRLVRQRVELESRGTFRLESSPIGTRAIVELP